MTEEINILIVDDHAMVRAGMRQLLELEADFKVVGEAEDGIDGIAKAEGLQPDVVVLDVAMPNIGGLEAIARILSVAPASKVIIFSMFGKESFAHEALRAGAKGYVLKGAPSEDLVEAIHSVQQGKFYFSDEVHAAVIQSYVASRDENVDADMARFNSLSDREKQVLRLMLDGQSNLEISERLDISHKTVEKHRTSVGKKLGVRTTVDLLKLAVKVGFVDPESLGIK